MKVLLLILAFISVSSASSNIFFVINNQMNLTCKDITFIGEPDQYGLTIKYNEQGKKKLFNLTQQNVGKKMGLIIGNRVIFFNINISTPLGSSKNDTISFSTQNLEDAKSLKKSFGNCNKSVNHIETRKQ